MNTIAKAILISTALTLPALSGNAYSHQQGDSSGSMMSPKMMEQRMMKMHEKMQDNHMLMKKIMAEENAGQRNEMMDKYKESMQQQMRGMNKVMSDELASGTTSEDMGQRMEMMNMRMDMMQMMMEQMMEHQGQAE